mgnify:CR=1 FL=1
MDLFKHLAYKRSAMNAHGLHSPLVYDLYMDILAEKKEFYSFSLINQLSAKNEDFQIKEAQLLYQLLNKYGLKKGLILGPGKESLKTVMESITSEMDIQFEYQEDTVYDFIHFTTECSASDINKTPLKSNLSTIEFISLSHPHKHMEQQELWKELTSNNTVSVTIDLWSIGICFPNKKQIKQHFILQNKHFQY